MADKHEVVFQWPHPEPNTVIVTGTFDDWAKAIHLTKGPTGFHGSTRIPWNEKIAYKFIVDGEWMLLEGEPTEADRDGNMNNIYTSPPLSDVTPPVAKPTMVVLAGTTQELPQPEPTMNATTPNNLSLPKPGSEDVASLADSTTDITEDVSEQKPETTVIPGANDETDFTADGGPEHSKHAVTPKPESPVAPVVKDNESDLSRDNAAPASIDEATIRKRKPDDEHDALENYTSSLPDTAPSPVAPDVPISIVPVNAPENNTAPPEILLSETQAPATEPTQPLVTTLDAAAPPLPEELTFSTHGIIAPGSATPIVGEINTRNAEPSPPVKVSHFDTDTTTHIEPEAVPLPPSASDLNSETSITAEPQIFTITDLHAPKTPPLDHAVEGPQEIGTHVKDSEHLAPTPESHAPVDDSIASSSTTHLAVMEDKPVIEVKENSIAVPSHVTEERPLKLLKPTDELSTASPHASETPEQDEKLTMTPSHTTADEAAEDLNLVHTTTDTTSDTNVPSAPVGDTDNVVRSIPAQAIDEPTPQIHTPIGEGGKQEEATSAAEPTDKDNAPSEEVTSAPPKPMDAALESSAITTAPTEFSTQPAPRPAAGKANGSAPPVAAERPTTNGHTDTTATSPTTEQTKPGAPASPLTPTKHTKQTFPSSDLPSSSPSSSKHNSDKARKKRTSFISKVKHLFTHDKDKEKK